MYRVQSAVHEGRLADVTSVICDVSVPIIVEMDPSCIPTTFADVHKYLNRSHFQLEPMIHGEFAKLNNNQGVLLIVCVYIKYIKI
jgi:hypothetical protein